MNEAAKIMVEESYEKGTQLYSPQDEANLFYILLDGRVRLTLGKEPGVDHVATKPGEVFGWSSIVGREFYTTHAECVIPTKLVKIDSHGIDALMPAVRGPISLEECMQNGALFVEKAAQRLAHLLKVGMSLSR